MARLATYGDLAQFRAAVSDEQRSLRSAMSADDKNTFLSHSSKDKNLIVGAIELLERHGGSVYVDVGDERMPDPPSVRTAEILRDAIRNTRRFVLLVTEQSKGSSWIPWELGLADGAKSVDSVALLPVIDGSGTWAEREYLGLYRRIGFGRLDGHDGFLWMVYDHHQNTATELSEWLKPRRYY
jgi:hypothetical protein